MVLDTPEAKEAFEEAKIMVRALALPHQDGISPEYLNRDFFEQEGQEIPFRKCGFVTLRDMISEMKDVVYWRMNKEGYERLFVVSNEATAHIAELVQCQMRKKKRKPMVKRVFNRPFAQYARPFAPNARPFAQYSRPMGRVPPPTSYGSRTATSHRPGNFTSSASVYSQRLNSALHNVRPRAAVAARAPSSQPSSSRSHEADEAPSSKGYIPISVRAMIVKFLERYRPDGLSEEHFDMLFKHEMKAVFETSKYGFRNSIEALKSLTELIAVEGGAGSRKIKLKEWAPAAAASTRPAVSPIRPAAAQVQAARSMAQPNVTDSEVPNRPTDPRLRRSILVSNINRKSLNQPQVVPCQPSTSKNVKAVPFSPVKSVEVTPPVRSIEVGPPVGRGRGCHINFKPKLSERLGSTDYDSLEQITPAIPVKQLEDLTFEDCDSAYLSDRELETVRNILKSHPKGITLPNFYDIYKRLKGGKEPDYASLGVGSMVEFINALPKIIVAIGPDPSNDKIIADSKDTWILFDFETASEELKKRSSTSKRTVKHRDPSSTGSPSLRKPNVSVPDVVSSTTICKNQLSLKMRLKLLKLIFDRHDVTVDNVMEIFFQSFHQTLEYDKAAFPSFSDALDAQKGYAVYHKDGLLKIDLRKFQKFAYQRVLENHAEDIIMLAAESVSSDVVKPGERFQDIDLDEMGIVAKAGEMANAHWRPVTIACVSTPRAFWIYLSKHRNKLMKVMDDLDFYQTTCESSYVVPDAWLHVGMVVAAIYQLDSLWHRGEVKSINKGTGEILVTFVDFGGTSSVQRKDIRLLKRDFFVYPAFAIKVATYGIVANDVDGSWNPKARDIMLNFSRSEAEEPGTQSRLCIL
ncbi:hypothetical protein HDE_01383 [Halotydeus destructor]|nr:hypothetical protein HDE_01383 [Halotydeus destructor]